jgi:hypothetical protein
MLKGIEVKTNKSCVNQPESVKKGILPKLPASYLFVGRSGSGKSSALHTLLTHEELLKDCFNYIFVFSGVKTDDILKQLDLPDENYITDFDEDLVEGIIKKIEAKIDTEGVESCAKDMRVLFIFDDILDKQVFLKSNTMRKLASANRHFLISWIACTQYYKAVPPIIRTNASAVVLFPSSLAEVERVADECCEPNMSKRQFMDLIAHATAEPYNFCFINNKAKQGERVRKCFNVVLKPGGSHAEHLSEPSSPVPE